MNLSTTYMGLKLNSPIIVSSSGLTNSVERIVEIEKSGAGAVVLKSLFEEQIRLEVGDLLKSSDYPEAEDYIRQYTRENNIKGYLKLVADARAATKFPIIASVNCISTDDWTSFARQIQDAGASAIELNINVHPTDAHAEWGAYEAQYFAIVQAVRAKVSIPIAVKIGMQFSNLPKFVDQLAANGAAAVVLFNRFYDIDIDVNQMEHRTADIFSTPESIKHSLRWIGILSARVNKIEFSASTGIHSGEAIVKQILAGAQTVQVCSVLYQKGIGHISKLTDELTDWMTKNGHNSLSSFRGLLDYSSIQKPSVYERTQFMRYFSEVD